MNDSSNRDVEIFTEALRLDRVERAAYLKRACGGDNDLRQRVEALLEAHESVGDFLEDSPQTFSAPARPGVRVGEKPGDRIGRYKLLEQIGEGGCGVVFVAQQEEPVRRQVALKIIKPGMDTKSVIARFEAERQTLALMDHPNIAKVFDAGATDSGRPYFVMELIQGIKITEYCNRHSLTTQARLILFAQVCEAVQHAHQKGVIHRDIKPSNILVTRTEQGEALPIVIDFGIAKATTNQQLTDKTFFTAFEMLIGTPAYMSPEQAALSTGVDVDTRTDIYSLGVLLYELLTGSTPFDAAELLKAGLDEVRRVIREQEPARPSTRLSTMTSGDLTIEAQHRQTNAPTLIRAIRGDLDWIAMKAMEKDRTRRYATAHGLALDVQRYLASETVSACPPSALYKFQKLVRRNRLLFAGIGLIAVLVVASLVVVSISLSKEKQAHRDAEMSKQNALTEATRSKEVARFLNEMLPSGDPLLADGRGAEAMLRDMLDKAAKRVGTELTNQPAVQADLEVTIGRMYASLGLLEKAETMIQDAVKLSQGLPGSEEAVANARNALASIYGGQGRSAQAEEEARRALATVVKLKGEENMDVVRLETKIALADMAQGKPADAVSHGRKALAIGRRLVGDQSGELLRTKSVLAGALDSQGNIAEAEDLARDCVSLAQREYGSNSIKVALSMSFLAYSLERQRKLSEAETVIGQSVAILRKSVPPDNPLLETALWTMGRVLQQQGKNAEAADTERELLRIRRHRYHEGDQRLMETASTLVKILVPDLDEAKLAHLSGEIPEAWAVSSENLAEHGQWQDARTGAARFLQMQPGNPSAYHLLAPLLVQTGDRAAYEELCASIATRFAGARDPYVADRMAKDCLILPRPGADLKTAADLAETAVTLGRGDSGALPYFQCCKALAQFRLGKYGEAEDWARHVSQSSPPEPQAEAAAILAMSQFKLKQLDKARTTLADCNKIIKERLPSGEQGNIGESWRDWIIAHALRDEAETLIEGEG